jgi:hypothetical protein
MDMEDPTCRKSSTDSDDPNRAQSKMDIVDGQPRIHERMENADPMFTQPRMEREDPNRATPYSDRALPRRRRLRIDSADPKETVSSTLIVCPILPMPYKEQELPSFCHFRKLTIEERQV